ncbi:gliding motility-associated C-terminal domain-containing protein [Croceivirga sp. JEA036]|uniref:gliding motility-associated C-terminal domain-containing protein n=1 Tax=Croceivirga sp. JEA036 TaxID=2721162 RepID=UPI00143C9CB1|nr:gliding motility-associated C-terminal domain-containing protein [Croceivirga sp. JEA036]NJB36023.1 gliding motility-associated C-terminal domain-containing protein [Croceivirga sp. JEA036]
MKQLIIIILGCSFLHAQETLRNDGGLKVFETGTLGVFHHMENHSDSKNQGLVGFYGSKAQEISGSLPLHVFDVELMNSRGLFLANAMHIENNLNFVDGNVDSDGTLESPLLWFKNDAFHTGASAKSKSITYTGGLNISNLEMPLGTTEFYRPIQVSFNESGLTLQCKYFYKNENWPNTDNYNSVSKENAINQVDNTEYWELHNAMGAIQVQLFWDAVTTPNYILDNTNDVVVVGWHKTEQEWHHLGGLEHQGNSTKGSLKSYIFNAPDYAAVTLAIAPTSKNTLTPNSQFISPNGDGINDYLTFEEIENIPENLLEVYNRYGILVYTLNNYSAEFYGVANVKGAITRGKGLASGIYYYVVTDQSNGEKYQGFFYLSPLENQ